MTVIPKVEADLCLEQHAAMAKVTSTAFSKGPNYLTGTPQPQSFTYPDSHLPLPSLPFSQVTTVHMAALENAHVTHAELCHVTGG